MRILIIKNKIFLSKKKKIYETATIYAYGLYFYKNLAVFPEVVRHKIASTFKSKLKFTAIIQELSIYPFNICIKLFFFYLPIVKNL